MFKHDLTNIHVIIQRRLSLSDKQVPRFHFFNKSRGFLGKLRKRSKPLNVKNKLNFKNRQFRNKFE